MAILKNCQSWLTRKQALKRSQDDAANHLEWRCDCTKREAWLSKSICEICELINNVSLKFWHNGASAHIGYICKKCFNTKKYYMIYFGSALN